MVDNKISNAYNMEPFLIITLVLVSGLVFERVLKHFKKSSCCGSTVEFNENASAPDLTKLSENISNSSNIPILKRHGFIL